MDNLKKILTLLIFIILFSQISLAIKVFPLIDAGELEPKGNYEFFISLTNQENTNCTVILSLTPRAEYLDVYIPFPGLINLPPYETREVKIELHLPEEGILSPGDHTLTILPEISAGGRNIILASSVIEIKFTLPGEITKKLELENFKIIHGESTINFQLFAKNTGNVRVGAFPFVEIQEYHGYSPVYHSTVSGKTQYLIGPGNPAQMNIKTSLDAGKYKAIAKVKYDNEETNSKSLNFEIEKSEEDEQEEIDSDVSVGEKEKDTETGTVNIGGEPQEGGYEAEKQELRISGLKVEQEESGDLIISLGIENIYKENTSYKIIFNIFDESGNKVDELTDSGEIEGYGTKEIKKYWYNTRPGDYKVRVELKYDNGKEVKEYWARIPQEEVSEESGKTPTGFLIFNPFNLFFENVWIILIIIIAGLIFIYYRIPKKKYKPVYSKKKSFEYTFPKKKDNKPVYLKRKYNKRK